MRSPFASVRRSHSPSVTMKVSILSLLSFPELENFGIRENTFDCAVVVSVYSDLKTAITGAGVYAEDIYVEGDWSREIRDGVGLILAARRSIILVRSLNENRVSVSSASKMPEIETFPGVLTFCKGGAEGDVSSLIAVWRPDSISS